MSSNAGSPGSAIKSSCQVSAGPFWHRFLSALVPEAFQLIDFWHAAQHLGAVAEHIFPQDSTARSRWFRKYRRTLRDYSDGAEKVKGDRPPPPGKETLTPADQQSSEYGRARYKS